jgi:Protein of Unknown function (DUF2784)
VAHAGTVALLDAVQALHYAFLAYLVSGGFLAWHWPRTIWLHLAAAGWAVLITFVPVVCPLTAAQNRLRYQLDRPQLRDGFIAHYVTGVLYPAGWKDGVRLAAAAVVLVSWAGYRLRNRRPARRRSRVPRTP